MANWSGWSEVPGGGKTQSSPAACQRSFSSGAFGDLGESGLHLFVRGTDDKIHRQRFDGSAWSGWQEVPGGRRVSSGPAATAIIDRMTICIRDEEGRILENLHVGGESDWRGWSEVPGNGRTLSEPALSELERSPVKVVRGTDNGIHFNVDGGWNRIPDGSTFSRPGVAMKSVFGLPTTRDHLHVIVRGTDDGLHHNIFDGSSWEGWREVPGQGLTLTAPAVANFGGDIFLTVKGTDDALHVNRWDGSWEGWKAVPGGGLTPSAPALASFSGNLYLMVRGTNDGIHFNKFG